MRYARNHLLLEIGLSVNPACSSVTVSSPPAFRSPRPSRETTRAVVADAVRVQLLRVTEIAHETGAASPVPPPQARAGRRGRRRRRTTGGRRRSTAAASCAPLFAESLTHRWRVRRRQVIDGPLVGVKPGDVARRNLQVEDAQRPSLKHLSMVRLLVNGHDWRLPISARIRRLPRRALPPTATPVDAQTEDGPGRGWRRPGRTRRLPFRLHASRHVITRRAREDLTALLRWGVLRQAGQPAKLSEARSVGNARAQWTANATLSSQTIDSTGMCRRDPAIVDPHVNQDGRGSVMPRAPRTHRADRRLGRLRAAAPGVGGE